MAEEYRRLGSPVFPVEWNGNIMVLAINKMREKGDWEDFLVYSDKVYSSLRIWNKKLNYEPELQAWFFGNPTNFLELMSEWLEEG